MYIDSIDPYNGDGTGGGGGGGGGTGGGGTDSGIVGGTDPNDPPKWRPGPNGWWEFWAGAWRWVTEPPRTLRTV